MEQNYNLHIKKYNITIPITASPHISPEVFSLTLECRKFKDWVENLNAEELVIRGIKILNVYMFKKLVGFVDLVLDSSLKSHPDKKLPGYVFLRGHSVGILIIVNETYMLLTKQFRVPLGNYSLETPAGMLDESGDFSGVAAKEIEEETSIKIKKEDLKELDTFRPSIGGCDEEIMLFYTEITLPEKEMEELKKKLHGDSSEAILLKFEKFTINNILATKDSKLICACFMYQSKSGKQIPAF